jgi:hypothetical protein
VSSLVTNRCVNCRDLYLIGVARSASNVSSLSAPFTVFRLQVCFASLSHQAAAPLCHQASH